MGSIQTIVLKTSNNSGGLSMRDSSYFIDQLSGRLAATHQRSVAREMFVGLKALGARFTLTICLLFGMVNVCTAQANTSPSQIRDHRTASASDQIVAPNNRSGTTQDHRTARTSENETSFDEADETFGRRTSLAAADETGDQRTITDEEKARIDKLTEAHRVATTNRLAPLSPKPTKKTAPGDFPDSDSNPRPPTGPVPIPYPNIPSSTDGSAEKKKTP
jgi:hypothetical protein